MSSNTSAAAAHNCTTCEHDKGHGCQTEAGFACGPEFVMWEQRSGATSAAAAQIKHTPGPLNVTDSTPDDDGHRQFVIENAVSYSETDGDMSFEEHYVRLSGYCGSYGPHLFAAAPALLEALRDALYTIREMNQQLGWPIDLTSADAAIAAATGGAQ